MIEGQSDVSAMKDLELDINQIPSGVEEECVEKEFGGPPRKKLRLTKEQSHVLEQSFKQYHILNPVSKLSTSLFLFSIFFPDNCSESNNI